MADETTLNLFVGKTHYVILGMYISAILGAYMTARVYSDPYDVIYGSRCMVGNATAVSISTGVILVMFMILQCITWRSGYKAGIMHQD